MQTPQNTRGQSCLQIQMPHEAPEQRAGVPASWTPSCSRLPPTFAAQPPSRGRCLQPRSSSSFISSPAQGVSAGAPAVNDFLRSLLPEPPSCNAHRSKPVSAREKLGSPTFHLAVCWHPDLLGPARTAGSLGNQHSARQKHFRRLPSSTHFFLF